MSGRTAAVAAAAAVDAWAHGKTKEVGIKKTKEKRESLGEVRRFQRRKKSNDETLPSISVTHFHVAPRQG